jgi:hypothetical protein
MELSILGKMMVTISKADNGFIVTLVEPPKERRRRSAPKDMNTEIDNFLDGMVALNKHMKKSHEGEGENWKGSRDDENADRTNLREAFKKLHPEFMEQFEPPPQPRIEQKVFGSKKDLFAYLTENL